MENIKLMLISPVPPPSGGDSTWAKMYLDYYRDHSYSFYHVNTSITGERAKTVSSTINFFSELKRCFNIWKNILNGLKKCKISIVHLNTNCSKRGILRDYISTLIVRLYKKPYIVHCRCNVEDQIGENRLARCLFRKIINHSKTVFVQNKFSLEFVSNMSTTPITLMPNFISGDLVVEKKQISNTISKVIFVGHVKSAKGINEFIEVSKNFPNINFVCVGPITNEYEEDQLKNMSSNVVFKGPLEKNDVIKALDDSDVFLFPTYSEGFSNSVLEAMSRGLPIITTNVGANLEMLEEKGGIITKPKDVNSLVLALKKMSDYKTRIEMSEWNINKVQASYTIESVVEFIRDIYRRILSETSN